MAPHGALPAPKGGKQTTVLLCYDTNELQR